MYQIHVITNDEACKIGVEGAMFFRYLMRCEDFFEIGEHGDNYNPNGYIYTDKELLRIFPFFSLEKIHQIINGLIELNVIRKKIINNQTYLKLDTYGIQLMERR